VLLTGDLLLAVDGVGARDGEALRVGRGERVCLEGSASELGVERHGLGAQVARVGRARGACALDERLGPGVQTQLGVVLGLKQLVLGLDGARARAVVVRVRPRGERALVHGQLGVGQRFLLRWGVLAHVLLVAAVGHVGVPV